MKTFVFNPYRQCTYVLTNEDKHAIIIDAGMYNKHEQQEFEQYIHREGITPVALLITHAHPDHVCGMDFIEQTYNLKAIIEPKEGKLDIPYFNIEVIATPGHKEDAVCYYMPDKNILFTGDTLFQCSIGRTDLPGGNMATLVQSLNKLVKLPEETEVYPGHGAPTTIGGEKIYNPYL